VKQRRAIYRDGFFKVSRRLLDSSLWCEESDVVKVFLVLMALSQDPGSPRNGIVYIARRQLAARCFLTEDRVGECIAVLCREDPQSRTLTDGGRRVEVLQNGFRVVNYPLYHDREIDDALSKARSDAGRIGGSRKSKKSKEETGNVEAQDVEQLTSKQNGSKQQAKRPYGEETETETRGRTDSRPAAQAVPRAWNQRACDLVINRYHGTAPGGRIGKALRPLVVKHGEGPVLEAFGRYVDETESEFWSPEHFATTYARWSDARPPARASPQLGGVDARNTEALRQFMAKRQDDGEDQGEGETLRRGPGADREGLPPGGRRTDP